MFTPSFRRVIVTVAVICLCSGCENKKGIQIGDTPPGVSGKDIQGEDISRIVLRGKVIVIYFWTDSCCGGSLKKLEPFFRKNRDKGLVLLAVNEGDTQEMVASYAKNNALTFTMLRDEKFKLFKQYQVVGFPTIFILDQDGVVREKILGDIQTEKLQTLVERQFKTSPGNGDQS